jgi:hypothetical protein
MIDPEALIIKSGVFTLAVIAVIRIVWQDINKMRNDFRRKRKYR